MKVRKSNIEIVKSYLAGERPFVTVGYTPPILEKGEGEKWTDSQNNTWEQKNGYKTKINIQADIIKQASLRKCKCGQDIKFGNRFDEKFFAKTGKCYDCIIKEETELRILGVFGHYENWKLLSNYLGHLNEVKRQMKDSIHYLENNKETSFQILCNGDGYLEKFTGLNVEELLNNAKTDLAEVNKTIKKVIRDKNAAHKIYKNKRAQAIKEIKALTV